MFGLKWIFQIKFDLKPTFGFTFDLNLVENRCVFSL